MDISDLSRKWPVVVRIALCLGIGIAAFSFFSVESQSYAAQVIGYEVHSVSKQNPSGYGWTLEINIHIVIDTQGPWQTIGGAAEPKEIRIIDSSTNPKVLAIFFDGTGVRTYDFPTGPGSSFQFPLKVTRDGDWNVMETIEFSSNYSASIGMTSPSGSNPLWPTYPPIAGVLDLGFDKIETRGTVPSSHPNIECSQRILAHDTDGGTPSATTLRSYSGMGGSALKYREKLPIDITFMHKLTPAELTSYQLRINNHEDFYFIGLGTCINSDLVPFDKFNVWTTLVHPNAAQFSLFIGRIVHP